MSETWCTHYGGEPCQVGTTRDGKHVRIADFATYEDAAAAVRARNSHDDLLAVCVEVANHGYTKQDFDRIREMARAAIAKAGGADV